MRRADDLGRQFFRIHLVGEEGAYPDLLGVSTFLLDLTTTYEVVRLGLDDPDHEFTRFTLYRNRQRVRPDEKLLLESLRHESPLDLTALFLATGSGVGTLWVLVQIIDKIWNMKLNHRKLRAEVEKLERENARAEIEAPKALERLEGRGDRVLLQLEDRVKSRLMCKTDSR